MSFAEELVSREGERLINCRVSADRDLPRITDVCACSDSLLTWNLLDYFICACYSTESHFM